MTEPPPCRTKTKLLMRARELNCKPVTHAAPAIPPNAYGSCALAAILQFAGLLDPYEFWPTTSHAARWIPPSDILPPNAGPGLNVQTRPEKATTGTGTGWRPSRQLKDAPEPFPLAAPMQKERKRRTDLVIKAQDSSGNGFNFEETPLGTAGGGVGADLLSLLAAEDVTTTAVPPSPLLPSLNFSTTRTFSASPMELDFDFVAAESVRRETPRPRAVTQVWHWPYPAPADQGSTERRWRRGEQVELRVHAPAWEEQGPQFARQTERPDQDPQLSSTVPSFVVPRLEQMQPAFYVPPGYYENRRRMMRLATATPEPPAPPPPPPPRVEDDYSQPTLETPLDLDFEDDVAFFESNRLDGAQPDYSEYERFRRTFQREGVKGLWNQLDRFQKSRGETVRDNIKKNSQRLGDKESNLERDNYNSVYRGPFREPNGEPANLGSLFSLSRQHPQQPPPRRTPLERTQTQKLQLPSYEQQDLSFQAPPSIPRPTSTTTTMRSIFGVRNPFLRPTSRAPQTPRPTPRLSFSTPTTAAWPTTATTTPHTPPSFTGQRYYSDEGTEDSFSAPSAPLYYSSTDRYIQTPRTRQSTYWDEIRSCCTHKMQWKKSNCALLTSLFIRAKSPSNCLRG